jgi:DNA-binding response OmpR family regulator
MKRILVMDDDEIVSEMLVQLLTEAGYEAESAPDGDRGLKLLAAKPFDLIIADLIMPNKEGIETIREIRANDKKIPIISISGGGKISGEYYLQLAKSLGADYSVKKPLNPKEFLAVVQWCLSGL